MTVSDFSISTYWSNASMYPVSLDAVDEEDAHGCMPFS